MWFDTRVSKGWCEPRRNGTLLTNGVNKRNRAGDVGIMRGITVLGFAVALAAFAAEAQTPGGINRAKLKSLEGTDTYVTAVMKERGAEDPNLRVVEVGPDYLSVMTSNGQRHTYLFSSLERIVIQEGRKETDTDVTFTFIGLTPQEQQIVNRAVQRAADIYYELSNPQELRLHAASLMALAGSVTQQDDGKQYIQDIHGSDDLASALLAAAAMYRYGAGEEVSTEVLDEGLESGNRQVRALAASLTGLIGYEGGEIPLYNMFRDRRPEISAAAAIALARLGKRDITDQLIEMLDDRNEQRGEAAISALTILAPSDAATLNVLRQGLEDADSVARFRFAQVLSALGEETSREVLETEIMEIPTLAIDAAIVLAKHKNLEALRVLRERRDRRADETTEDLIQQARMAAALIAGGDRTAIPTLQNTLRMDQFPQAQGVVCQLILELGMKNLLVLVQPVLESSSPGVALGACNTAVGMAYPDFRERLMKLWES